MHTKVGEALYFIFSNLKNLAKLNCIECLVGIHNQWVVLV